MATRRRRHPGSLLVPMAVRGDCPTIQPTADAAHDGDVGRIDPGTYTGDARPNQELGTATRVLEDVAISGP